MRAPAANNDGMGCLLTAEGCRFRVWAPNAKRVQVVVVGDFTREPLDLAPEPGTGNWSADRVPAKAGDRYQYHITNRGGENNDNSQVWVRTDARALQVESSNPAAMGYVVDPKVFTEGRQPFRTPAFENFILYQLHIGSFAGRNDGVRVVADTATFVDAVAKLDHVRGLGFNAIQLMPVSDAWCDLHGAGELYGPSDLFASEERYATRPDRAVKELVALVDAAHSKGLAVIVDVVYNHASTIDNRYWRYDGNYAGDTVYGNGQTLRIEGGIYFVHGHHTEWGEGFAVWQQEVKDLLLDNARMYLRDYRVDGLRFDAAQAIDPAVVRFLVETLRGEFPDRYLIAEYSPDDPKTSVGPRMDPYDYLCFCATWNMGSPWQAVAALNGQDVVANLRALIGDFASAEPWRRVNYLAGSHDEIFGGMGRPGVYLTERFGGRDNGWARAKTRLAWALNGTLPGTPMLFMGTEGHLDGHWDPVVDGGDWRLDWERMGDSTGNPMRWMVADANRMRWEHAALRSPGGRVVHEDAHNGVVAFTRWDPGGDVLLVVVNAGDGQWGAREYGVSLSGEGGRWREIFNSQAPDYGGMGTVGNPGAVLEPEEDRLWMNLPSWGVLVFAKE